MLSFNSTKAALPTHSTTFALAFKVGSFWAWQSSSSVVINVSLACCYSGHINVGASTVSELFHLEKTTECENETWRWITVKISSLWVSWVFIWGVCSDGGLVVLSTETCTQIRCKRGKRKCLSIGWHSEYFLSSLNIMWLYKADGCSQVMWQNE